ncbi:hypothetical protein EVAR_2852_1 [Eumeta japonica]|uniref:Uncharacterized protein n=1 Tax=Eumeta variegata TaxID=151549 RepID=A0A4C1T443_EUMVA|nr:hypothetical protein EVAR_2852_1 [Eumeta japonica]
MSTFDTISPTVGRIKRYKTCFTPEYASLVRDIGVNSPARDGFLQRIKPHLAPRHAKQMRLKQHLLEHYAACKLN